MPSAKALLASTTMAMGAAALGTVVYMQVNPLAFTSAAPRLPEAERAEVIPANLVEPPDTLGSVVLEPVRVTGTSPATRAHEATPSADPRKEFIACSEWRGLASGPADRQVRMLCEVEVPSAPVVPGA